MSLRSVGGIVIRDNNEPRGAAFVADVCRSVLGNLFPCASVTLGWHTTTQIP
jgi:hypothetical protein